MKRRVGNTTIVSESGTTPTSQHALLCNNSRRCHIRIGLYHGWELTGSGSNEYARYLAATLADAGDHVHLLCREEQPERIDFINTALRWHVDGSSDTLFSDRDSNQGGRCTAHILPHGPVRPVFVLDKQRPGNVKAFVDLTDSELEQYRALNVHVVDSILRAHPVDVLHANHMILQPSIAADVGQRLGLPFIIYPHGSAIEYTVRRDPRYHEIAGQAIDLCAALIIGSHEVRNRLMELYPDRAQRIEQKSQIIGVGVDTDLFYPVKQHQRLNSIQRIDNPARQGGKRAQQEKDLRQRLDRGDVEALMAYKEAYCHELPDENLQQKLLRIPWQKGKVALFVGALTVGKGLQSVIAGLPQVLATESEAHLVIVGSGAYREVLEAQVHAMASGNRTLLKMLIDRGNDFEQTHLKGPWKDVAAYMSVDNNLKRALQAGPAFREHIHFLGRLDHRILRYIFPCADIAIFPSIIPEAYPLVLMESLSAGVLPAASNFSGFAEGLDQLKPFLGETLVDQLRLPVDEKSRVAGIAQRIKMLIKHRQDRSEELRSIAVNRYDWKIRAAQMQQAYQSVVNQE